MDSHLIERLREGGCGTGCDELAEEAADRIEALEAQNKMLVEALEIMTKCEPCDCGCPSKSQPILLKPQNYYAIARKALAAVKEGK